MGSLVRADGDNLFYLLRQGSIDDVLGTDNIGEDGFEGIIFACRNLLESGRVDDDINATPFNADISDEVLAQI